MGDPADLPEVFSLCGILKVNSSCNSPFVAFILCAYLGIVLCKIVQEYLTNCFFFLMQIEYPIQRYDSSLSYWGNVYVLVHFAVTIVAYQLLIARRMVCFM